MKPFKHILAFKSFYVCRMIADGTYTILVVHDFSSHPQSTKTKFTISVSADERG